MSRGKETSSKDIARVIKYIVSNPEASLRDVERATWIPFKTVDNIKNNLALEAVDKSEIIAGIIDSDKEIIQLANDISLHKFTQMADAIKDNPKDEVKLSDVKVLSEIADKSTKRVSIFWGEATDKNWGLKLPTVIEVIQPENIVK